MVNITIAIVLCAALMMLIQLETQPIQYFTCTRTTIPARRVRVYKGGATKMGLQLVVDLFRNDGGKEEFLAGLCYY
jgi:hypothetical protein